MNLSIVESTITANHVGISHGAGGFPPAMISIVNSIIAGNAGDDHAPDSIIPGTNLDVKYSLLGDASGTTLTEAPVGSPDANGNLIGGPVNGGIDPKLGPLAYNGGPVFLDGSRMLTHALLAGSPAIDAGDPTAVAGTGGVPEFDQRGRRLRGSSIATAQLARIDMGAYERQPGETYHLVVDTLADEDDGDYSAGDFSLREAIAIANANPGSDTIEFAPELMAAGPATILLTHGELLITDAVTINGPGANLLTIDAGGNDPTPEQENGDGSRVFNVGGDNLIDAAISGLTLTGGDVNSSGGAIRSLAASLTLVDVVIAHNAVVGNSHGGGLFAVGAVDIVDSRVESNRAVNTSLNGGLGGGISASGSITITRSMVNDNETHVDGGGIYVLGGDLTLLDSTFSNNVAGGDGGAISASRSVRVERSTISGNTSGQEGGGISSNGDLSIFGSTIQANASGKGGGGILVGGLADLLVADSTISGNSAFTGGGIAHCPTPAVAGTTTIVRSTITGNHATSATAGVGGVLIVGHESRIEDSIIAVNSAVTNPDLKWNSIEPIDLRFSLIGDGSGTSLIEAPIGSPDANGNRIGGPVNGVIDPLLGPLADNGGPTKTHGLLPGSPAIDAGDPAAVAGTGGVPEFDQRGAPFSRVVGGRIDMGAVEWQVNPLPGDYNFNGVVDAGDYTVWRDTLGSTTDLRADGSSAMTPGAPDGVVDEFDYAWWKANFGNVLEQGAGSRGQGVGEEGTAGQASSGTPIAGELRLVGEVDGSDAGNEFGELRSEVMRGLETRAELEPAGGPARRSSPARGRVWHVDARERDRALLAWTVGRGDDGSREKFDVESPRWSENSSDDLSATLDEAFAVLGGGV